MFCGRTMSYVSYDIVYFLRLLLNIRHRRSTYDIVFMTYDVVRLIMRSVPAAETTLRPPPGACQLEHGCSFPVIFAFFPASQSAGQHETRALALDDAQNGPGHMAQQCPVCDLNCADPQGVKEPHGTNFHAPERFAPALGRPGKGRFCMCSSVNPLRSGGSVTGMTPYVRKYKQEWTMMGL